MTRKKKQSFPGYEPLPDLNLDELFNVMGQAFGKAFAGSLHIRTEPQIVEVSIPEEMFRKLIMLCHPDKHSNSDLSHEVTRWLIEQRKHQTNG